ncbi:hypothetical protein QOU23_25385, partial [Pseudomonas aeruginosa]
TIFEYFGHEVHFWMFEIEFFRPSLILNYRKINGLNEIHGNVEISPEGVAAELALPLLILVCTSIDVFGRPSPTSASSPNSGAPSPVAAR